MYPDRMTRFSCVEGREGASGKDDDKVGCLEAVAEFEEDNGPVGRGCFSTILVTHSCR